MAQNLKNNHFFVKERKQTKGNENVMFELERQEKILEYLQQKGSASVKALSELLYVSQPTVRRDLSELENQGKVLRTHGGAVLRKVADGETSLHFRETQNVLAKKAVAEKAAKLIHNGDVLFLDASSTVSYLLPYLEKLSDIIVITNSPKLSVRLGEKGIKNYCTGGALLLHSIAYVGNDAIRFVSKLNADLFFFSSDGITEDGLVTDTALEEAEITRAMMEHANKSYLLYDSTKIGKKYLYSVCNADELAGILCEKD